MKKEPVIVYEDRSDVILIENKHKYSVNITLGLSEGQDFYVKINFKNLTLDDFKLLNELGRLERRLVFSSELIEIEKFNITHIVITNSHSDSLLGVIWECLSDDPSLYDLIIK
ncbi:hypothetical protein [Flavobacterium ustbae]|uniref:hypothetical protein n=1 Tax=Flavobacterium ustbae TaxID=2488790 RepID=UPI000F7876FF|nr:hypothetical protein [Flavobacterium ustbae]